MAGTAVLVQGGSLSCKHQGKATIASGSARLTGGGNGVLLHGEESQLNFPDCQNKTTTQTPSPAPCVSDAATAGVATKLTVGGTAVLLGAWGPDPSECDSGSRRHVECRQRGPDQAHGHVRPRRVKTR
jgi:hypothetical protein